MEGIFRLYSMADMYPSSTFCCYIVLTPLYGLWLHNKELDQPSNDYDWFYQSLQSTLVVKYECKISLEKVVHQILSKFWHLLTYCENMYVLFDFSY